MRSEPKEPDLGYNADRNRTEGTEPLCGGTQPNLTEPASSWTQGKAREGVPRAPWGPPGFPLGAPGLSLCQEGRRPDSDRVIGSVAEVGRPRGLSRRKN